MKYLAVLGLISLTACTTTSNMNVVDLNYYKIDCERREEQTAFLTRQMPTERDRWINGFRMTSVVGVAMSAADGTYHEERATYDNRQAAIARLLLYKIEAYCPPVSQKPQGCLHVNEDMPSGSAQGAVCHRNRQTAPAVKRWEVIAQ